MAGSRHPGARNQSPTPLRREPMKCLNHREPRVIPAEEALQAGTGGDLKLQASEPKAGLKASSGYVFQRVESLERSGPARTI